MSTKIYTAYRMSPDVFENKFIPKFKATAIENAGKFLLEFMSNAPEQEIINKCKKLYEERLKWDKEPDQLDDFIYKIKDSVKLERILELIVKIPSINRLDASFNAFLYKGMYYVIPYGCVREIKLKGVEDFGYWDNVDQPEGITIKEWNARGRLWDKIALDDWNKRRLTYIAIEFKESIGMSDLLKDLIKKEKFFDPLDRASWAIYYSCYSGVEDEIVYLRVKKRKEEEELRQKEKEKLSSQTEE